MLYVIMVIFLILVGFSLGAVMPDIDLAPLPVWRHRSAWTHGPLMPLGLVYLSNQHPGWGWIALGFIPAFILHIGKDMFPKRWHGNAKISTYPIRWRAPALISFTFLLVTLLISSWLYYHKILLPTLAEIRPAIDGWLAEIRLAIDSWQAMHPIDRKM